MQTAPSVEFFRLQNCETARPPHLLSMGKRLRPGDVVRLKSGEGPLMTLSAFEAGDGIPNVDGTHDAGGWRAHWHVQGAPKSSVYPAAALALAEPAAPIGRPDGAASPSSRKK